MSADFGQAVVEGMKVIDFHMHPYRNRTEDMCMYAESFYLTPEEAKEDLEQAGIGRICGSVLNAQKRGAVSAFTEIRAMNGAALELKQKYGDFYTPGFHVHPGFVRESLEEVERMHRHGLNLVGELVPYMHGWKEAGFDYASKELWEILDLAGEYGMVVSYHTMLEWPEQMEEMVKNCPKVTFVAAHPGQVGDYLLHEERMRKYPNLYLDLSGTGIFRYGILARATQELGSERFLFGTDYPICNPRMYVQAVLGEHIPDKDKENILWKNAERLLGK